MQTPRIDTTRHEVSWVSDGKRVQAWFQLPSDALPVLNDLFRQAEIESSVVGLGFLEIPSSSDEPASTAQSLVDTLSDALFSSDYDWSVLGKLAAQVDKVAQGNPQASEIGLEFVWENGGFDDNLFTQGFHAVPGHPTTQQFIDLVVSLEQSEGFFYDVVTFDMAQPRTDDTPVQEMIDLAARTGASSLVAFMQAIQSADVRHRLLDVAHCSDPPGDTRRKSPRM
jgi:hypothetical protein